MGQVGPQPAGQIRDYNPGIARNGVFWTIRIPAGGVAEGNAQQGTASYRLTDLPVKEYGNIANALAEGPSRPATVSFDVQWGDAEAPFTVRDSQNRFTGEFRKGKATLAWSAREEGATFVSHPASTSKTPFSVVGQERNGVFFS